MWLLILDWGAAGLLSTVCSVEIWTTADQVVGCQLLALITPDHNEGQHFLLAPVDSGSAKPLG